MVTREEVEKMIALLNKRIRVYSMNPSLPVDDRKLSFELGSEVDMHCIIFQSIIACTIGFRELFELPTNIVNVGSKGSSQSVTIDLKLLKEYVE
ncbi:MAG: hypothetical protein Q8L10_00090 [Candidatus Moranbacteria bacterium]|nr:hypothetical protein [Candidatus Moranbacteria bacterium]